MSKEIHELKQAGEVFYPKTSSDAVMVEDNTLTEILATIKAGDGISYDALIEILDDKYLSKITVDTAAEVITFLKGIKDGNFVSSSTGWSIGYDSSGNSYMEIDKLLVRMEAIYRELVIEQLSYVGGARIASPAAMTCSKVETTDTYYRCYFYTGENGEVVQQFEVDDQARCQVFSGSNTKYYWGLVIAVGDDYIDISTTDIDGSGVPAAGDDIVLCGNRTNTDRQNCIIESSYGDVSYIQYAGINSFSLTGKEVTVLSPSGNKFVGDFYISSTSESISDSIDGIAAVLTQYGSEIDVNSESIQLQTSSITTLENSYSSLSSTVSGLNDYIDSAVADGVLDITEIAVISALRDDIVLATCELDAKYDVLIENIYLSDDEKTALTSAKSTFWAVVNNFLSVIDDLINDVTDENRSVYNTTYVLYTKAYVDYVELLDVSINSATISMTSDSITLAVSNLASQSDLDALTATVDNLDTYIDGAVADGVLDVTEIAVITAYKDMISTTTTELLAKYSILYDEDNESLTDDDKSTLTSAKSAFDSAATSLISAIDTLIDDVTDDNRSAYETAYAAYQEALSDYTQSLDIANNTATLNITSEKISLAVDDLSDDLLATGIDIENGSITVTSDSFKVQNNDGETTFTVFEDGKIKTELIDTSGITISEMATSDSGKRVVIKNNALSMYDNDGDMKLLISGDDLGSSASNTTSISVSAVQAAGSGEEWDVEETTFATFTVTDSNNTVTIPAIYITTSLSGGGTGYLDNLVVTYYIDGIEMWSQGLNGYSATISSNTNTMSVGTHTLSYSITGRGTSTASYTVNINTDGVSIVVKYITELLQFSGNGMRGTFGNAAIELTDEGVILSYNDYILRISSSGIQKSTNGGGLWSSI